MSENTASLPAFVISILVLQKKEAGISYPKLIQFQSEDVYKRQNMHYVYVMVYISLAVAMQLLTGNFPVSFFAFPLNLVFAALWLLDVYKRQSYHIAAKEYTQALQSYDELLPYVKESGSYKDIQISQERAKVLSLMEMCIRDSHLCNPFRYAVCFVVVIIVQ